MPRSIVRTRCTVPYAIRCASARARSPDAAQELVVRHALLSLGLYLDRNEPPVLEPRAPDRHAPPVQRRPRADVRRERAHAPPRVDRVVEVQLAVLGADLVRVADAVLELRRE